MWLMYGANDLESGPLPLARFVLSVAALSTSRSCLYARARATRSTSIPPCEVVAPSTRHVATCFLGRRTSALVRLAAMGVKLTGVLGLVRPGAVWHGSTYTVTDRHCTRASLHIGLEVGINIGLIGHADEASQGAHRYRRRGRVTRHKRGEHPSCVFDSVGWIGHYPLLLTHLSRAGYALSRPDPAYAEKKRGGSSATSAAAPQRIMAMEGASRSPAMIASRNTSGVDNVRKPNR
jgi:hypothetical protein